MTDLFKSAANTALSEEVDRLRAEIERLETLAANRLGDLLVTREAKADAIERLTALIDRALDEDYMPNEWLQEQLAAVDKGDENDIPR
jgi:hypothetical protein